MGIALVILDISKLRLEYVVVEKKTEKNCFLYVFSVQIPKSLLSELLDKNSFCTYNQLYTITLPNIWHCQIGHIGLLGLYKLEKEYLEEKLQGKTIS